VSKSVETKLGSLVIKGVVERLAGVGGDDGSRLMLKNIAGV